MDVYSIELLHVITRSIYDGITSSEPHRTVAPKPLSSGAAFGALPRHRHRVEAPDEHGFSHGETRSARFSSGRYSEERWLLCDASQKH